MALGHSLKGFDEREFTIDEETRTAAAWIAARGLNRGVVLSRWRNGIHEPAELFSVRSIDRSTRLTWEGRTLTFTEWAVALGIHEGTFYLRHMRGLRGEALFCGPKTPPAIEPEIVSWQGVRGTRTEVALAVGVSTKTLSRWLRLTSEGKPTNQRKPQRSARRGPAKE